jgi:hypothetical protein
MPAVPNALRIGGVSDDEACEVWSAVARSLPLVEDDVIPEYRHRDDE